MLDLFLWRRLLWDEKHPVLNVPLMLFWAAGVKRSRAVMQIKGRRRGRNTTNFVSKYKCFQFSFFLKWIRTYFSLLHCFSISCCKINPGPMDLAENGPDFVNTATYIDNWPCSTKIIWYFSPSETIQQLEVFTLPWPHLDPHWAQCQSGKVQQNIVQYWTSDKPLINHDSCSQTLLPYLKIAILKSHLNMV